MTPHLETVAGEAYLSVSTSNISDIKSVILIVSPELIKNFRLSSKAVFKFSTHPDSIGPSNTSHFALREMSTCNVRSKLPVKPSIHSLEF